jgi:hypothetical protein
VQYMHKDITQSLERVHPSRHPGGGILLIIFLICIVMFLFGFCLFVWVFCGFVCLRQGLTM